MSNDHASDGHASNYQAGNDKRSHGKLSDAKKIIVALDTPDEKSALALAATLDPDYCRVKVGKELFTSAGPNIVEALQRQSFDVFLDLKFHDIPNTVSGAVRVASELGVWMVNVHAAGGERMMVAAREAISKTSGRAPLLIAVTVLTSMEQNELQATGVAAQINSQVELLASLANNSGCDGVVCSALEATMLSSKVPGLLIVTPGIRLAGDSASDQRRVMTPVNAVENGADYLVIGRSVTGAADPVATLKKITTDLENISQQTAG